MGPARHGAAEAFEQSTPTVLSDLKEIARVPGVDPTALRTAFPDELETGATKANSRVAESLYRKAIGEGPQSVTAAIFWLKTRAKWKETNVNEITGPEGASPINEIVVRFVSPGEDVKTLPPVGVYGPDGHRPR